MIDKEKECHFHGLPRRRYGRQGIDCDDKRAQSMDIVRMQRVQDFFVRPGWGQGIDYTEDRLYASMHRSASGGDV